MIVEHSTDRGKTWSPIEIKPTSPLARHLEDGDYVDDCGNRYRKMWTQPKLEEALGVMRITVPNDGGYRHENYAI